MSALSTLILGAGGQLGRALCAQFPTAIALTRADFDVSHDLAYGSVDWSTVGTVINASAYTDIDGAETEAGALEAWNTNVVGVGKLARVCEDNGITLVHISSVYVLDGEADGEANEDIAVGPLSPYGESRAAGDALVSLVTQHLIVRTSWLIADDDDLNRTLQRMTSQAGFGDSTNTQRGRPTLTSELSKAIEHLLDSGVPWGIYNVTNSGDVVTWAELVGEVRARAGATRNRIDSTQTANVNHVDGKDDQLRARCPRNVALDLGKIRATGYEPADWRVALHDSVR